MTSFVETTSQKTNLWYPYNKGGITMPNHIIIEDIFDEMIDEIEYIKMNSFIKINNKKK